MAPDPVTRDRLADLADGSGSRPGPEVDDAPDPAFWGTEPRAVRRSLRAPEPGPTDSSEPPEWWGALVDRVRNLRVEVGIGILVVAVVALVAGVVWYRMAFTGSGTSPPGAQAARRDRSSLDPEPQAVPAGAVAVTTPPAGREVRGPSIVVHVAGAVARPGVLLMPEGARVIDAVEGAGGATPEADLDRLNLAAELVDGQRILVVAVGAPAIADPGGAPTGVPGILLDLNLATSAQLEELPGIGPALAAAIVAERDRRGGFRSVNELREVRGIGDVRFADLRDRVTV